MNFFDRINSRFYLYLFDGESGGAGGSGEAKVEPKGIDAAINKALEDKKEEPKIEAKKEEPKKEEVKVEDLSVEQLQVAKDLFKVLNHTDPNIRNAGLEMLVKAAGQNLAKIETPKDAAKVEETLLDLLKNGLGEYDFLADKLAPVLEKALDKFVAEKTKDIREEIRLDKEAKVKDAINTSIDNAFAEFTNSTEVKDEVVKLMDQFKPSAGISHKDYFRSLIVIAANNKNIVLKSSKEPDKNNQDKINKNRNDAPSRIASERGAEVKEGVKTQDKKMNLTRSIEDAVEKAAKLMNA